SQDPFLNRGVSSGSISTLEKSESVILQSLRLRAIALALRALRLRAIALALRALRLRAIALALRALRLRAIALALRALRLRAIALALRWIIAPKDATLAVVVVQLGAQYSPRLPCAARSHIEFRGHQHSERRRCKVNPNGCPVRC